MPATTPANATDTATRAFHALSDGTRLQILQLLRKGECCVCELMDHLDAAQSRLSFHLRILKEAGLVTDRREGRWVYYAVEPDAIAELISTLDGVRPAHSRARSARRCE
jgi:ArsR family transcriptional regulator